MKIVIDISEEDYNFAKREVPDGRIANGIPLPKGRMIILSEDAVKREQVPLSFSCQQWISEVGLSNATVAIIEAEDEE